MCKSCIIHLQLHNYKNFYVFSYKYYKTDNASFVNYYLHYSINIKTNVVLHIPKKMRKKREYYATLNSMFQNGWKIVICIFVLFCKII